MHIHVAILGVAILVGVVVLGVGGAVLGIVLRRGAQSSSSAGAQSVMGKGSVPTFPILDTDYANPPNPFRDGKASPTPFDTANPYWTSQFVNGRTGLNNDTPMFEWMPILHQFQETQLPLHVPIVESLGQAAQTIGADGLSIKDLIYEVVIKRPYTGVIRYGTPRETESGDDVVAVSGVVALKGALRDEAHPPQPGDGDAANSQGDIPFTHPFGNDVEFYVVPDAQYLNLLGLTNTPLYNTIFQLGSNGEYQAGIQKAVASSPAGLGLRRAQSTFATASMQQLPPTYMGVLGIEADPVNVPPEYQPLDGDRVVVFGRWIIDSGHDDFHTEIHPPLLLVSARAADRNRTHARLIGRAYFVSQLFRNIQGEPVTGLFGALESQITSQVANYTILRLLHASTPSSGTDALIGAIGSVLLGSDWGAGQTIAGVLGITSDAVQNIPLPTPQKVDLRPQILPGLLPGMASATSAYAVPTDANVVPPAAVPASSSDPLDHVLHPKMVLPDLDPAPVPLVDMPADRAFPIAMTCALRPPSPTPGPDAIARLHVAGRLSVMSGVQVYLRNLSRQYAENGVISELVDYGVQVTIVINPNHQQFSPPVVREKTLYVKDSVKRVDPSPYLVDALRGVSLQYADLYDPRQQAHVEMQLQGADFGLLDNPELTTGLAEAKNQLRTDPNDPNNQVDADIQAFYQQIVDMGARTTVCDQANWPSPISATGPERFVLAVERLGALDDPSVQPLTVEVNDSQVFPICGYLDVFWEHARPVSAKPPSRAAQPASAVPSQDREQPRPGPGPIPGPIPGPGPEFTAGRQ